MQTLEEVTNFLKREAELQNMKDEIERLRKALKEISSIDYRGPMPEGVSLARKALDGKND